MSVLKAEGKKVPTKDGWLHLEPVTTNFLSRLSFSRWFLTIAINDKSSYLGQALQCFSSSACLDRQMNVIQCQSEAWHWIRTGLWDTVSFHQIISGHLVGKKNEYSLSGCLRPQHSISQVSLHQQRLESSSRTCLMRFGASNNWIISSASHFKGFVNKVKQV